MIARRAVEKIASLAISVKWLVSPVAVFACGAMRQFGVSEQNSLFDAASLAYPFQIPSFDGAERP